MKLFPHQIAALEQTKDLNRVAYYLDMGLGKTFVGSEKANSFPQKILIVCQKSKVNDWIEHFQKYYPITVFDLTDQKQLDEYGVVIGKCVGVINYDLVFRRPELMRIKGFTLMLDESSMIQNGKAKRSKFILKLNPDNVILLSGTPTSGKYENLWTQCHLLGWEISLQLFQRQYVNWTTIDVGGVPLRIVDKENPYKNIDRLKRKLRENGAVFMKTEECFELPEQTFIDISVNDSKEYRTFKAEKVVITDETTLTGETSLKRLLCERQLCGMYSKNKLQAFKDLVSSTQDRLIVFYNFNNELAKLKKIVEDLDKPVSEVNGHNKDLTAYEEADNSVTLIQYQAGSMGLNLQKANKAIYFTLPLMSELFEQSKKRIHRIGQKSPCFYYTLTVKNSVECDIKETLEKRKDYTDALFECYEMEGEF